MMKISAGAALVLGLLWTLPQLCGQEQVASSLGKNATPLVTSENLMALGFTNEDTFQSWPPSEMREAFETVESLSERRVHLVRRRIPNANALGQDLGKSHGLLFATPLFHIGDSTSEASRYILTNRLVVAFQDGALSRAARTAMAARVGLIHHRELTWAGDVDVFEARHPGVDLLEACDKLQAHSLVRFAHPDWLRYLGTRNQVPTDPLFGNQWHLHNTGQGGGLVGADISCLAAWDEASGFGTTIAVIDTGVDPNHFDLLQLPGFDPNTGTGPTHAADNSGHGTRVAGVAAAKGGNSYQTAGVAWQARVMPIRLLDGAGYGTPVEEATCFIYATDNGADVITNSWGPDGVPFPLPALVEQSFVHALFIGRGGRGTPIFWAAGNGGEDLGTDEYVSSAYTIAVGATTNQDQRAVYSDYGSALDLMAPSSGGTRNVTATDIGGGVTLNFGGTSASAPMAAGVAALMLEANPALTWQSVGQILRGTADPIQPAAAGYNNGGHSPLYGHGRLNAEAAVDTALTLLPLNPQVLIFGAGPGDIQLHIWDLEPHAEWALGASLQLFNPLGTGPLFGVGYDAWPGLNLPLGSIPFRFVADGQGRFSWRAQGVPAGFSLQAVVLTIRGDGTLGMSDVVQAAF